MKNFRLSGLVLYLLVAVAAPAVALDSGVENLRQTGKAFASVARAVSPSVVFIQVEGKTTVSGTSGFSAPFGETTPFGDDLFRRFFGEQFQDIPRAQPETPRRERRQIGQGSGFVFSTKDGLVTDKTYILTNNHVVDNADSIRVRFQDGREFDAEITGRDPQTDIAVIEISNADLPALSLGDSSRLEVGEWVVAIGNPFGLNHTLTVGVVSATGRTTVGINDYEDFIQTDAAINPGNSGGPLVDLDGEVVGMNTAIFSRSGGYMGVGFAIPSNLLQSIARQLIDTGEVIRGYLGIVIQSLTPDLAEPFDIDPGAGILVAQVSEDSPAQKAGLRQGDVIVAYRGKAVNEVGNFRNRVSLTPPGSREELTIVRNGKRKTVNVTIGTLAGDSLVAQAPVLRTDEIGLTVQELTPQLARQFDARPGEGVLVTDVRAGSIAAMAGIDPGTIVLQVNRKAVNSPEAFTRALQQGGAGKRLLLLVRKGDMQRFVALSW